MSVHEPGICPICGQADLDYGLGTWRDGQYDYECTCSVCGFAGREVYDLEFVGYIDNKDLSRAFIE